MRELLTDKTSLIYLVVVTFPFLVMEFLNYYAIRYFTDFQKVIDAQVTLELAALYYLPFFGLALAMIFLTILNWITVNWALALKLVAICLLIKFSTTGLTLIFSHFDSQHWLKLLPYITVKKSLFVDNILALFMISLEVALYFSLNWFVLKNTKTS